MAKPIPGKRYTIEDENTLYQVAARAYGDGTLWPFIWKVNQSELKSGDPNLIFPGEVIFIPVLSDRERLKLSVTGPALSGKAPEAPTLILDSMEIIPLSARCTRTMDTLSDGWSVVIPWTPGENPELDRRIKFFSYTPASFYIGSELMVKGHLFITVPDSAGSRVTLKGAAFTKNIIDSALRDDHEKNNVTLLQRCRGLCEPFGISVTVGPGVDFGGAFERVATSGPEEKIGAHLVGLAKQRANLLTSTPEGQMLITQAASGAPVATLEEGKQGVGNFNADGDGTKRFRNYRAIGNSPDGEFEFISKDDNVPVPRFTTFTANDTTEGGIAKAANWARSKTLADALTFPIPVSSVFDPSGKLWRENTLVTVKSPYNFLPNGFTLLIRSVDYIFGANGDEAVLNVVPPQVYTGEPLVDPWQ